MHFLAAPKKREGVKGIFLNYERSVWYLHLTKVFPLTRAWMGFTISHDAVGGDARDGAMGHRDGVFDEDDVVDGV